MDVGFLTRNKLFVGFVMLCVASWPVLSLAEKTARIMVLSNSNEIPYQQVVEGFKKQIMTYGKFEFTELNLSQPQSLVVNDIGRNKPDLIFALGIDAIKWADKQESPAPVVATMVMKEDVFKKAKNTTGVSLGYSLRTQFQWLKKFFPQQSSVAILYNPSENAATVNEATQISQQEGFRLVAIPVENPKELPYALDQLTNKIELLLAIPDETVMSTNTAKEVLLASFRNKVPLVGLSDNWVKSGAIYALSWDYDDLGRQNAVIAQKILDGASPQSVLPEHPRKVTYTINAKIAEHMNMDIPGDILKNAKMVFN